MSQHSRETVCGYQYINRTTFSPVSRFILLFLANPLFWAGILVYPINNHLHNHYQRFFGFLWLSLATTIKAQVKYPSQNPIPNIVNTNHIIFYFPFQICSRLPSGPILNLSVFSRKPACVKLVIARRIEVIG